MTTTAWLTPYKSLSLENDFLWPLSDGYRSPTLCTVHRLGITIMLMTIVKSWPCHTVVLAADPFEPDFESTWDRTSWSFISNVDVDDDADFHKRVKSRPNFSPCYSRRTTWYLNNVGNHSSFPPKRIPSCYQKYCGRFVFLVGCLFLVDSLLWAVIAGYDRQALHCRSIFKPPSTDLLNLSHLKFLRQSTCFQSTPTTVKSTKGPIQ